MDERTALATGALELRAPARWDDEPTFSDVLYEWTTRAPWLAISAAFHAVVLMILTAIPWELLRREEPQVFISRLETPDDVLFPEPPEEPLVETPPEEPEEPVLVDAALDEPETDDDVALDEALGEPDFLAASELDAFDASDALLGLGGGPQGTMGARIGGRRLARHGGEGTERAVELALGWLAAHQDEDGRWDADGFMKHDPPGMECDGAGDPSHDVGATALALLAFLGDGSTTERGRYRENVRRGLAWLLARQDGTGLYGQPVGHAFVYDHALATLAVCESLYFSREPVRARSAQRAVNLITRARNPYSAWRYGLQPTGDNDTSVTGWMVFALKSAEEAGLEVDRAAFAGALAWLDEATDPATGRVGYDSPGSASSRVLRVNDHYPTERGEAMTAVGLLCRFFLGQDPDADPVMRAHAELLRAKPPVWDADGLGNDMYYWYYGSYAMFQMGGKRHWKPWNEAMKEAVLDSQRRDGSRTGSWDPVGPWGRSGGRVYSTATMVLCLEVYYRYAKVLGAR